MRQQHGQMIKVLPMSEEEICCEHEAADKSLNQHELHQISICTSKAWYVKEAQINGAG